MRPFLCSTFAILASVLLQPVHSAPPPNVLMIAIDDQNDWLGSLGGHPQVKTPHLDALAARGTNFTTAHCQAPLCNPSRTSLLTGLRPGTTGVYGLQPGFRQVESLKHHITLPQAFMRAGYYTYSCGKIYHDGSIKPKDRTGEFTEFGPAPAIPKPEQPIANLPIVGRHPAMDWGVFPERDEDQADWKIADAAIEKLKTVPRDRPWLIATGFRLPHVPCFASKAWFDLYPTADVKLPLVKADDRDDLPRFAGYLHWKLPEPRLKTLQDLEEWRPLVRAYLAPSASWTARLAACWRLSRHLVSWTIPSSWCGVITAGTSGKKGSRGKTPSGNAAPACRSSGRARHHERTALLPTGGTARHLSHPSGSGRTACAAGPGRSQPRAATQGRPGTPGVPRHHHPQPEQSHHSHGAMALHTVR
nr:sulfatase-like hydrolase/transferase [Verrucomicrobium spinosum]